MNNYNLNVNNGINVNNGMNEINSKTNHPSPVIPGGPVNRSEVMNGSPVNLNNNNNNNYNRQGGGANIVNQNKNIRLPINNRVMVGNSVGGGVGSPVNQVNLVNQVNQVNRVNTGGIPVNGAGINMNMNMNMRGMMPNQSAKSALSQPQQVQQQQQQQQLLRHQLQQQAQQQAQAQRQQHPQTQTQTQTQQQQAQQAQLTQQQIQKQRHQILFQKLKNYKFSETSEEILAKYANFQPSLELHIHENYFRFGNQVGMIPKTSPLIKELLEYIAREQIPDSLVEVIKDGGIQLYEGCCIIQIYDHRHMVEKIVTQDGNNNQQEGVNNNNNGNDIDNLPKIKRVPKTYRTLLKPTQLSIFADLLYQMDSQQFRLSDHYMLLIEAEILTLTKRNVDLSVPLNPFKCNDYLQPETQKPVYDAEKDEVIHDYRKDLKPYHFKPLHEDIVHHNKSDYEQLMMILSDHGNHQMGDNLSNSSSSSQFLRLKFVENWRRKRERMKQAAIAANIQYRQQAGNDPSQGGVSGMVANTSAGVAANNGFNNGQSQQANGQQQSNVNGLGMFGLTQQQRYLIQQQRLIQQQQQLQMSNAINGTVDNNNMRNNNNSNSQLQNNMDGSGQSMSGKQSNSNTNLANLNGSTGNNNDNNDGNSGANIYV
ncbi:hypothetical protein PACTADRAFT_79684 [Pachysolen tannophilus NRRL Y-2460]|uniref:Spt20-like SEP domain-containing protein n=1 Tax=Pachysolen tannophilus NRRL Y-2460 TaxID=669874 RepID=A0A1E4TZW5_PACTA|nr:hypothetical protein PACTADRAFT_79684 [Pachysolen tannophilus NRRL Y-2460]